MLRKGCAEWGVGVHERRAGQVQPHELHQHLVGICRSIKRTGARAVVACHFGGHQLAAVNVAGCELLAHTGLFVIGQATGHRACWHKHRRDIAECTGSNNKTRHDFITHTQIHRRIISVVRQANACGQCDHIARKQRQLHANLALGHTITHGRNAARNLGSAAVGGCGRFDQVRKFFERLVGRKHVIIGSDDANVGGLLIK